MIFLTPFFLMHSHPPRSTIGTAGAYFVAEPAGALKRY